MEILVLVGILLAVFLVEILYYRLHALENLSLKVSFSKNIADFGEDIELIEVAENKKRMPLPFIILKFETPREFKFYDTNIVTMSDFVYRRTCSWSKDLPRISTTMPSSWYSPRF